MQQETEEEKTNRLQIQSAYEQSIRSHAHMEVIGWVWLIILLAVFLWQCSLPE